MEHLGIYVCSVQCAEYDNKYGFVFRTTLTAHMMSETEYSSS